MAAGQAVSSQCDPTSIPLPVEHQSHFQWSTVWSTVDIKRGCAGLHYNCLLAADRVRTLRVGLCERQQRRDRHLRQHELDIPPSLDNVAPLLPLGDLTIGGECCSAPQSLQREGVAHRLWQKLTALYRRNATSLCSGELVRTAGSAAAGSVRHAPSCVTVPKGTLSTHLGHYEYSRARAFMALRYAEN